MSASCVICSGPTAIEFPAVRDHLFGLSGDWTVVRCKDSACRHGQLDPLPTDQDLTRFYASYITHEEPDIDGESRKDPITRFLKSRPAHKARKHIFLDQIKPDNVLEIGSGNGVNLLTLKRIGWTVEGQELDPVAAEGSRSRGVPVRTGFLHEVEKDLGIYRAIIMVHVIEHLRSPVNELILARKHLKKNGQIIVITPNFKSLPLKIFGRFWAPLHVPFHLQHFTRASLNRVMNDAGLRVEQNFTTSTHSASNIRASLAFAASENPWLRILSRVPLVFKTLEAGLFALLGLAQALSHEAGDECVMICSLPQDRS